MPNEKILDKLGKIKAHMESAKEIGNEHEAQAFAAMLQNLLTKHKLEMTDIQYSSHLEDEPVEEIFCGGGLDRKDGKTVYRNYPDVEVVRRRIEWTERLASTIAEAHSCAILISSGRSSVWFVGRKSDTSVVEFLFITMLRTAEKLSHKEYMKFRRQMRQEGEDDAMQTAINLERTHGFKASFLDGFISRLFQRFEEEKRKMESSHSGTALMRINKEALAVGKYLDEKSGKTAKALGGGGSFNREGYCKGQETADGVGLRANAMNQGGGKKELR